MRHLQRDIFPDHTEPDDDVDRLFNRLEPLEPPADLVVRILSSISRTGCTERKEGAILRGHLL